ncbi:glycosyltransferase family 4 protein [Aliarcobacter butzleri]|uniref:glycosyltransferase family 4 protein n=1 Tax=Aliarcobacter butzleri TaxID=28197 RepID=UPI0021B356DA|nr:glycosyltransferase family 4 protein [Aliarcobacter butzleri]MCT7597613.1 glycosyltransferase family 4 protein [Aliarcobacter butzleri]
MNIWIFNHHALTPDMSGGTRHYDFAKELIKRGHSVTIIASSFHYSKYKEMKDYKDKDYLCEKIDGIDFIWIKTPPYFGNGMNRVKNMIAYTYKVLKYIPKLNLRKPDIIVGSSVHLFAVWSAYKLSCRYKTPFIMEVRDLWPQTLIDMGISKWHPFIILLGLLERYLYKKADKIISNLPYAYDYIGKFVEKEKFIWISNGVDLSNIKYISKEKSDKFTISYTGAIGVANNLHILLNVAKKLKDKENIYFRIVGEGAEKEKLKVFVKENNLSNISIENSVPKNEVTNILQNSDILYFNLKDSPVFNYGISSNKLYDYMASGRVIIFSTKAKNNPIKDANAGYSIAPDDVEDLEKTILEIYNLSQEKRDAIGQKIRKYAEQNYSIEILVDKFEKLLEDEIRKKNA